MKGVFFFIIQQQWIISAKLIKFDKSNWLMNISKYSILFFIINTILNILRRMHNN